MARSSKTTVDTAYDKLLDLLVTFTIKPGTRLNESELAADLSMSRAPVREALNRLIADDLVRFEPGRGFFCRRLSVQEIADLYDVRLDLETGALLRTMSRGRTVELEAFVAHWREALTKSEEMDINALVQADEQFHLELARLASNAPRVKYLCNINDRIRFVRRINLEETGRYSEALAEHADLLEAIASQNTDAACAILRDHLLRSTEEVRQHVQNALTRIYADDVA
ncbi:MAG: GntR family transcriptional regulator [Hoeflea sp. D1-CHI-28]